MAAAKRKWRGPTQLEKFLVAIDTLREDPANARNHGTRNRNAVRASIERYGQRLPIVVQKKGMIVRAGNARLEAMKAMQWTHAACLVLDDDDATALGFALADNRTADLADWNSEMLAHALRTLVDLEGEDFDLETVGFTMDELAALEDIDRDYSGLEGETQSREGQEDARIVLIVPESHRKDVLQWLGGDGPYDGTTLGHEVLKKCGLRS